MLKQRRQDLEGLFLDADFSAMLAQFTGPEVQFEYSKKEPFASLFAFFQHGEFGVSDERQSIIAQKLQKPWGTTLAKPHIGVQLPEDLDSSGKELSVH
jgi:hypothetical protein